jgi:hypothetical protein
LPDGADALDNADLVAAAARLISAHVRDYGHGNSTVG